MGMPGDAIGTENQNHATMLDGAINNLSVDNVDG